MHAQQGCGLSSVFCSAFARCDVLLLPMQGYLPGQLYNLNSKFGNQEELKALCAAFKEAGVRPVCEFLLPIIYAAAATANPQW